MAHTLVLKVLAVAIAAGACSVDPVSDVLLETREITYTGNIRISLAHPYDINNDDYELLIAVPADIASVGLCESDKIVSDCTKASNPYFDSKLIYATADRKFFKIRSSALLENNFVMTIVAANASGAVTDTRHVKFAMAGAVTPQGSTQQQLPQQQPQLPQQQQGVQPNISGPQGLGSTNGQGGLLPGQGGPSLSVVDIPRIVGSSCGGAGCHADYAANPTLLRANPARARRMTDGSMPRGRSMPDAEKQLLIRYMTTGG